MDAARLEKAKNISPLKEDESEHEALGQGDVQIHRWGGKKLNQNSTQNTNLFGMHIWMGLCSLRYAGYDTSPQSGNPSITYDENGCQLPDGAQTGDTPLHQIFFPVVDV